MKKEYEAELRKISRVSGALILVLSLTLVILLVAILWGLSWILGSGEAIEGTTTTSISGLDINLNDFRNKEVSTAARAGVAFMMLATAAYITTFLVLAIRLLVCFRKQKLFSDESVRYARLIAWLYTISLIAIPVAAMIFSGSEAGSIMNFNFNGFIVCGILWLFAWMLQVGRALQLDSELAI